jgi:hypothetical protein
MTEIITKIPLGATLSAASPTGKLGANVHLFMIAGFDPAIYAEQKQPKRRIDARVKSARDAGCCAI